LSTSHLHRFSHFAQLTAENTRILYNGPPLRPPQNCPLLAGSGPPSNTWCLGPTRVHISNDMSIGSAVFQGSRSWQDRPTDVPTDRTRYSVCNNRPHLRTYFHTRCGVSANLECRSEMCCTRLAENTGRKNSPKIRHLRIIAQLCQAISSRLKDIYRQSKKNC